jgi:hypothetical protein
MPLKTIRIPPGQNALTVPSPGTQRPPVTDGPFAETKELVGAGGAREPDAP